MRTLRLFLVVVLVFSGCSSKAPKDYKPFREFLPKSILIMPPGNTTNSLKAPESFMAAVAEPLAEAGYYVFPPLATLKYFQSQGVAYANEAGEVSGKKLREVFGADAALYSTVEEWGEVYQVITAHNTIKVQMSLVDLKSGNQIWTGQVYGVDKSGGNSWSGILAEALIHGLTKSSDADAIALARGASYTALHNFQTGLIYGTRRPNFAEDTRGR